MEKSKTVVIGQSIKRIDAPGKVTGETPYPGDIDIDEQLWLKIELARIDIRTADFVTHAPNVGDIGDQPIVIVAVSGHEGPVRSPSAGQRRCARTRWRARG